MPSPNPPRKFAPTPIEQSTKSSRQTSPPKSESASSRRFAPQLVETTSKSSSQQDGSKQNEAGSKPRRFAPQVVEESRKSSSGGSGKQNGAGRPHIRFNVEPISTTRSSNRKSANDDDEPISPGAAAAEPEKKVPRKFAPVLLDTAKRSRRAGSVDSETKGYRTESGFHLHAKEHRRHITGKATPAPGSDDEMEVDDEDATKTAAASSPYLNPAELRKHMSPADRRASVTSRQHSFRMPDLDTIESSESEREASNPSSLSSSVERNGSPFTPSESSHEFYKHATRVRESVDESFTHYLLELERKKAQQRLEEQALAAYPNADWGYEPPHHYVNTEDDESDEMEVEDRPVTFEGHEDDFLERVRRESAAATMSWEQIEMQRHAEKMQNERKQSAAQRRESSQSSPWWRPGAFAAFQVQDSEISSMRDRARPPMLGNDLVFPRCPSPEPARFDVTQSASTLRNQMNGGAGGESAPDKASGDSEGGLWTAPDPSTPPRVTSAKSSGSNYSPRTPGLWGGFCVTDDSRPGTAGTGLTPSGIPTGLMTPMPMSEGGGNPFEKAFASPAPQSAFSSNNNKNNNNNSNNTTPAATLQIPSSNHQYPSPHQQQQNGQAPPDLNRIDSILISDADLDAHMEREFPDTFITQVFNYLSLGYPALARPFDGELAKISRISIAELRKDDIRAKNSPRGYIRLGPDFEGRDEDRENGRDKAGKIDVNGIAESKAVTGVAVGESVAQQEEVCVRWQALKLYVREWARQERNMGDGFEASALGQGNWGTGARRGSWAL